MKTDLYLILISIIIISCNSQHKIKPPKSDLEVFDIANIELSLLNKYKNSDSTIKNKILVDTVFEPYSKFWNGYLGNDKEFINWVEQKASKELGGWNEKSKYIKSEYLTDQLRKTAKEMSNFTGYFPQGKWYILYGPSWTDLGGFGDGTMLIDLASNINKSSAKIIEVYPHEINHQIYANMLKSRENIVLNRILDEGFATYVSYLFHKKKYSIAEELKFSQDEFKFCKSNEKELLQLLENNYRKNDEKLSRQFADRNYKFKENYPGAVGYYLGFRIVEEFVKNNGKNSWKEIYTIPQKEVLEKSKILE